MRILGLDLGIGSIGWALIEVDEDRNPLRILGMGSRIVRLTVDESANFDKGSGESVCSQRTAMRTARKGLDRYQLRREQLEECLCGLGMLDKEDRLNRLSPLDLWRLRAEGVTSRLTLHELGRVLMHINQKRGYKHAKSDVGDSRQTEYVARVNANFSEIKEKHQTIGQSFYEKLKTSIVESRNGRRSVTYRIKDNVFPRQAYIEEAEAILRKQSEFYPDILTDMEIERIKNIIFYQRPLKSCKHLVSVCEFEKALYKDKNGREVAGGPKVAPRTSPLAQVCRIWEAVNNIRLTNVFNRDKKGLLQPSLFDDCESMPKDAKLLMHDYPFSVEEKLRIFDYLNTHEKLTETELLKLLGLKKSDGFKSDRSLGKGIQGNSTYTDIRKALGDSAEYNGLLEFRLDYEDVVDKETGEVSVMVSPDYISQPLYELWHTLYSISDKDELFNALRNRFGITDVDVLENLYVLDFVKAGYSNKSAKFMRKIIPFMRDGMMYSEACAKVGVNHSGSISKEENESRELRDHLDILGKNELRQPVVEKILNQMINIVNALIEEYGEIDEIRIELARQLRQSKEQRADTFSRIGKREKENKTISEKISELHIQPSRNRIQKYRLWEETGHVCMYCGQPVKATEFLEGNGAEIEHIIPRSIFFDDSFSNKVCSCRKCNRDKGNSTGYDFMASKSEDDFTKYLKRVEDMYSRRIISKTKRDRLMTPGDKIPVDFLNRDLVLSQYIARKASEILRQVARNVWATSGSVTDFLRHAWGYDEILHDINVERYSLADRVEEVEFEHAGQTHKELRIKEWSKRLDHRHHALDALTIALTQQSAIQRLNNLNKERVHLVSDISESGVEFKEGKQLLRQWASSRPHFPVEEVARQLNEIAVSFKSGKKLATPGKRYIRKKGKRIVAQDNLLIPRMSLHQESIYGKIKLPGKEVKLSKAFEMPERVVNQKIRRLITERLEEMGSDVKVAVKSLKKRPISILKDGEPVNIEKVRIFEDQFVIKYPIDSIKFKDIESVVDGNIRKAIEKRFEEVGGDDKKFVKSLEDNPIIPEGMSAPVRTVRCLTGLKDDKLVGVRRNGNGDKIGFAKTGSNHHVAIYKTKNGGYETSVVSSWTALKRKKLGIPVIISDPAKVWDVVANLPESEDLEEVVRTLPSYDSELFIDMKMGDMFILGMNEDEYNDAVAAGNIAALYRHLYRVQKLAINSYYFRFHTETVIGKDENIDISMDSLKRATSINALLSLNPHKIIITPTGKLIL